MFGYGGPVIGILYDATAGNNDCNGKIAVTKPNDPCPDLKACLHLEDVLALLPARRIYSHIRLVARNLLSQHRPPLDDRTISNISQALIEKMYVHGHGIGRKEAKEIGLDVVSVDNTTEAAMWSLYEEYESVFHLRDSKDAESYFPANSDVYERPNAAIACIESEKHLHEFSCKVSAQRIRNIPQNPAINVNLGFQFPANVNPQQLPQQMQLVIQQILQQAAQQLPGLVAQELQKQSPIIGLAARAIGGAWRKLV